MLRELFRTLISLFIHFEKYYSVCLLLTFESLPALFPPDLLLLGYELRKLVMWIFIPESDMLVPKSQHLLH